MRTFKITLEINKGLDFNIINKSFIVNAPNSILAEIKARQFVGCFNTTKAISKEVVDSVSGDELTYLNSLSDDFFAISDNDEALNSLIEKGYLDTTTSMSGVRMAGKVLFI